MVVQKYNIFNKKAQNCKVTLSFFFNYLNLKLN